MSFWTNLRDIGETVLLGPAAGIFNDRIGNIEGGLFNKITGRPSAEERRSQQNLINDQIRSYREQTDLTNKQLSETQSAKDSQRRMIQEKQIRSLRNNYRPSNNGFLNNQSSIPASTTVGTSPGLTNKLGIS